MLLWPIVCVGLGANVFFGDHSSEVTTRGYVTDKKNGRRHYVRVHYEYMVNGEKHTAIESRSGLGGTPVVGSWVDVRYDKEYPGLSTLDTWVDDLKDVLILLLVGWLFLGTLHSFLAFEERKRKNK